IKREALSPGAQTAAARRAEDLLARVRDMKVEVESWPLQDIQERAIEVKHLRDLDREHHDTDPFSADENTKTRWTVNFIRHNLSSYDYALADVAAKTGTIKARNLIRAKVYAA